MNEDTSNGVTRRGLLGIFAATVVVAAPTYSNAFGILTGAGDIRRIRMYSGRTGESIDTIYWLEGNYIPEAMKEINYFMRDWRTGTTKKMDGRTIDIMAASHRLLDVNEPYMLLSGYRSPQTNAMLRSRSGGVARNDDLKVASPFVRIGGAGNLDIGNNAKSPDAVRRSRSVTGSSPTTGVNSIARLGCATKAIGRVYE